MTTHPIAAPVLAIPCFTLMCEYTMDGFHVTTDHYFATEELAKQVCDEVSKDPRKWGVLSFVDGHEYCKNFYVQKTFREEGQEIWTDFDDFMDEVRESISGGEESEDSEE